MVCSGSPISERAGSSAGSRELEGQRLESGESAAGPAVAFFGELLDLAAINAHETELARDEETVGQYQHDYRGQPPDDLYKFLLPCKWVS